MRVVIEKDYKSLSEWTANYVVSKIREAEKSSSKSFVLGLPTGSTPIGTYQCLVNYFEQGVVSFKNVITFNMDEYVGISESHPQSYHYFMKTNLFDHIDIKEENIHILNGNASDLKKECSSYEQKIKDAGGIDLFLGGIGPDGHIAFNEPGSSLSSRTRVKTLTEDTLLANSRFFGNDVNQVPKTALTVGVQTIMDAKTVLILANGHAKARALAETVQGGVSQFCPLTALQLHPGAIIVCDEAACYEIKHGTYKYFKDIEKSNIDPESQLRTK